MVTAASTPRCEVCGREWTPDADPDDWLGIEVDHAAGRIYAALCSREHAVEFFGKPLPEPPPRIPPPPLATGERVMIIGIGGLAVIAFGVFVVGLVVLVRDAAAWF